MSDYISSTFEGDPIKHPERIPFDIWWSYNLCVVATCQGCGREREIPNKTLMDMFGRGGMLRDHVRQKLALKLKCGHCDRYGPELRTEVRKN